MNKKLRTMKKKVIADNIMIGRKILISMEKKNQTSDSKEGHGRRKNSND